MNAPSYELLLQFIDKMGAPCLFTSEPTGRADDSVIYLVNYKLEVLSGYGRKELVGKPPEILVPDDDKPQHKTHRQMFLDNPHFRSMGYSGVELKIQKKNGNLLKVGIELSPLQVEDGFYVGLLMWPFFDKVDGK